MLLNKDSFFTSGIDFDVLEAELRTKYQMMNVAIVLSSIGLIYGISINIWNNALYHLAAIESFLFLFLMYTSEPLSLKHIWLFTYPIILLYFQEEKTAIVWVMFMLVMLLIIPLQPFIHVAYTMAQISYLSFVLLIVSAIIYFYKQKMDEAKGVIFEQQLLLSKKLHELIQKDKLLTVQSKQAVMGEMISMIAHQWRQPLSTITLNISNLQVKKMLDDKINGEDLDKALENISETISYLSQTIDDFQTYFRPGKELGRVNVHELVEKAVSFVTPRIKKTNIINNAIDELLTRAVNNPEIKIDVLNEKEEVSISISDNAGGIAVKHIESIFEPYFSTKGKNGTGLGLYMSQMIMQKHFSTQIKVQSTNYGASFTITVPKKLA